MRSSLNKISDVGPIRARGRKRTPSVRLQDQECSIVVHVYVRIIMRQE